MKMVWSNADPDPRESLGCDQLKRYEGFNKGNDKVAVTKSSGTWGGGK